MRMNILQKLYREFRMRNIPNFVRGVPFLAIFQSRSSKLTQPNLLNTHFLESYSHLESLSPSSAYSEERTLLTSLTSTSRPRIRLPKFSWKNPLPNLILKYHLLFNTWSLLIWMKCKKRDRINYLILIDKTVGKYLIWFNKRNKI